MTTDEQDMRPEDLERLTHAELLAGTQTLAREERRISLSILHHLAEIDRRRSFAKLGYGSLWDYALKELKYSESAAYRRIAAMRALRGNPALEESIQAGALSVSTVSQIHSFFRAEQNQAQRAYTPDQKAEIFRKCENMSTRDVTRELLTRSPLACRVRSERAITDNRTLISFVADPDLLGKIHRVKDLCAARLRDPSEYSQVVDLMSETTLDAVDPMRKPDRNLALITPQPIPSIGNQRYHGSTPRNIPAALRTRIWRESGGRCTYVSPETGKRCDSTFGLEIEHCKPHGLGGSSLDPANLRLLCRKHNQWQAIQTYGLSKMEPYLKKRS